jgi:hypothetical protein
MRVTRLGIRLLKARVSIAGVDVGADHRFDRGVKVVGHSVDLHTSKLCTPRRWEVEIGALASIEVGVVVGVAEDKRALGQMRKGAIIKGNLEDARADLSVVDILDEFKKLLLCERGGIHFARYFSVQK